MKNHPEALKLVLIQKCLSQPNRSLRSIAKEVGISKSTLHGWIHHYRDRNPEIAAISSHEKTLSQRLKAIIDCSQFDEVRIGEYCRSHGIYRVHLEQWKGSLMEGHAELSWRKIQAENDRLRKEKRQLKQALKQSERSLAEARALLELKKKAQALLKGNEDDSFPLS